MASSYWKRRVASTQAAYDRADNRVIQSVSKAYDRAMRQVDTDIDAIVGTYARKTGMTAKEAKAFLSSGAPDFVMDELRARAAAVTDSVERGRLRTILNTEGYKARISRLEAIKVSSRIAATEAAEVELLELTPHLSHIVADGYSRTLFAIQKAASLGFAGAGVPSSSLSTILKSKWSGTNYSRRVWSNRDAMASMLDQALMEMSTIGKLSDPTLQDLKGFVDLNKWKQALHSKFKEAAQYQKYAVNRLVRTESAYVAGQATALAYDECEIGSYEFVSVLDSRTSPPCQALDGKVLELKDKEMGVNWPPLHPFCRSSTVPVLDGATKEGLQRRGRDKNNKSVLLPADMDYAEWKRWQDAGCPELNKWLNKRIE